MSRYSGGRRKGAGFYFGRFLTAVLGLMIGAGLFFWQALDSIDYVRIKPVKTNSSEGLEDYIAAYEESSEKMGRISVDIDPDYPILATDKKDPKVENYLVFGVDSRDRGEACRADSIIVVTLDKNHNTIKLTSILRDTEVGLNHVDNERDKINASYAYGGVGMLINTINSNFDLDISKFVMFDFWSAMNFVDALGGVTMDISEDEVEATNQVMVEMCNLTDNNPDNFYLQSAGRQKLNGLQAISWARVRYIDSDFGRTSRQRQLMETILKEFSQRNRVQQASFAVKVIGELETNIDKADLIASGLDAASALDNSIQQYYVPQEGMYDVDYDNWNMIFYPDEQIPELHEFIWGDPKAGEE